MNRLDYKINDVKSMISHTKMDILCYAENIQQILDTSNNPEYIEQLKEDREIDKQFLELLEAMHESLIKLL